LFNFAEFKDGHTKKRNNIIATDPESAASLKSPEVTLVNALMDEKIQINQQPEIYNPTNISTLFLLHQIIYQRITHCAFNHV
jgi:hypothetical protein